MTCPHLNYVQATREGKTLIIAAFKLAGFDGDNESDSQNSNRLAGRRTIYNLEKSKTRKKQIGTLDVAFKKRFFALNGGDEIAADGSKAPRKTKNSLNKPKNALNGGGGTASAKYTSPRKFPSRRRPFEG